MTQRQYMQLLRSINARIEDYYRNPDQYTDEDVEQLMQITSQLGIKFSPKSSFGRKAGIALGSLADTLLLGAIPNSWYPKALTTGDRVASGIGQVVGILSPFGAPSMIGRAAFRGAKALVPAAGEVTLAGSKLVPGIEKLGAKIAEKGGGQVAKGIEPAVKFLTENIGKTNIKIPAWLNSAGVRGALGRGIKYGAAYGSSNLVPDTMSGDIDRIISKALGGVTMGTLGKFISTIGKDNLSILRNLSRLIAVKAAAAGTPLSEEDVRDRLLMLAGTF